MKSQTYVKTMFFLGLAGVLFSGYLSAVKLFSHACAWNSPCPYFLGYPACWYGFAMFLIIFIAAMRGWCKSTCRKISTRVILTVSGLGILFSGYFTIPEIKKMFSPVTQSLPLCSFGLIFYLLIFILSIWYLKNKSNGIELKNENSSV